MRLFSPTPGFAPMYATRSRRVKTDKRDARALCEACKLGAYRPIHRVSDAQRHVRAELAVRDAVVRTRTRYVALIKAAVRREGRRLGQADPERTAAKLAAIELSAATRAELAPLIAFLEPLNAAIADADRRLALLARDSAPGATAPDHADDRPGDGARLRARRRHALRGAAPSRGVRGRSTQRTEFGGVWPALRQVAYGRVRGQHASWHCPPWWQLPVLRQP